MFFLLLTCFLLFGFSRRRTMAHTGIRECGYALGVPSVCIFPNWAYYNLKINRWQWRRGFPPPKPASQTFYYISEDTYRRHINIIIIIIIFPPPPARNGRAQRPRPEDQRSLPLAQGTESRRPRIVTPRCLPQHARQEETS